MGTSTLAELTIQAEQIDRIENNVEKIHNNVDKANRLLKGIESLPGAIGNALSKDIATRKDNPVNDRTVCVYISFLF